MNSGSRKRKHRAHREHRPNHDSQLTLLSPHADSVESAFHMVEDPEDKPDPLQALYIQAYEADVIRGPRAKAAAESLEVYEYTLDESRRCIIKPMVGSALIRWGGETTNTSRVSVQDDDDDLPQAKHDSKSPIWVDRYDARLLLDALPDNTVVVTHDSRTDSPTGWSDLSSDAEDTFFFSRDEVEDFRKEKRRKLLERTREERLKARMEEDGVQEDEQEDDIWGGSDEEPDEPQKDLMRRTATHLLTSPNAAHLEMRILANHGGDRRFAFLRGRWSRTWNVMKAKARMEKSQKDAKETQKPAGLGVLTGYGSDESGAESDTGIEQGGERQGVVQEAPATMEVKQVPTSPSTTMASESNLEEAAKEARRKRAREWAEKRRGKNVEAD
ncbi:hypothetical protein B0H34DRAFT_728932 [Crassisporium funariophilum]|nr:hypothetical protein B0H34DRAFT_728932 [Crassisporium funariophilum]